MDSDDERPQPTTSARVKSPEHVADKQMVDKQMVDVSGLGAADVAWRDLTDQSCLPTFTETAAARIKVPLAGAASLTCFLGHQTAAQS